MGPVLSPLPVCEGTKIRDWRKRAVQLIYKLSSPCCKEQVFCMPQLRFFAPGKMLRIPI
jgi:hypothetical protein